MSTMTSAPVAAPPVAGPSRGEWVVGAFKAWWVALMRRRLANLAIHQLKAMSDRQLKDIGIVRSQIEVAVRGDLERGRTSLHWF